MRSKISAFVFAVVAATGLTAQADSVICRDGTSSVSGRGACSHHKGVAPRTSARHRSQKDDDRVRIQPRRSRVQPRRAPEIDAAPRRAPDVYVEPRDRTKPDRPNWYHMNNHQSDEPTAVCNDGEMSYSMHHRGACSQHGGVARWL